MHLRLLPLLLSGLALPISLLDSSGSGDLGDQRFDARANQIKSCWVVSLLWQFTLAALAAHHQPSPHWLATFWASRPS